ncbi:NYN domain-containing protein [Patescibacteria group bacterium AH-259-L07]|nr:NYN domain-containing protein [Patescibacteria group bacterium AH-259-L07]
MFIEIAKCNFDVELTIDAIRLIDRYDTFALFSGDSDFSMLLRFLKNKNKKVILFYAGHISQRLKDYADLLINAQRIKNYICDIKIIKKNPSKGVRKSDSHPRAG